MTIAKCAYTALDCPDPVGHPFCIVKKESL